MSFAQELLLEMGIPGRAAVKPGTQIETLFPRSPLNSTESEVLGQQSGGPTPLWHSRTILAVSRALGAGTTYAPAKQTTNSGSTCTVLLSTGTHRTRCHQGAHLSKEWTSLNEAGV